MDAVVLARIQFAVTIGFHFLFAPLGIGLSWFLVWMISRWERTGDALYGRMARFWTRIFTACFAVGVATGLTMEFQFGTNWAEYSKFVGDIFGAPLAAEGITAFFLESSFLGVLNYGFDRFPVRILRIAAWMIALGATLSAFWIIVANSWQQTPAGFEVINGHAQLTNFWAAVFNPSTLPRYFHTVCGAITTGAFFIMGVGAWLFLRGKDTEYAKKMIMPGMIVGFIFGLLMLFTGHAGAFQVANTQPEKLAAVEGLFQTQARAPALLFGIPDLDNDDVDDAVRIPGLLSLLAGGDPDDVVQGLNDFPRENWPPVYLTFFSFHLMVLLGMLFIAFPFVGLFFAWRKTLFMMRWFLWIAVPMTALPFIANELGWITAEVGRQPWTVYHVLRTSESASLNVPAAQVLSSLIFLAVLYAGLFVVWAMVIGRLISSEANREVAK